MSTAHRCFKNTVYEQVARLGKAVSAPKRLELLDLLCQGPRTVEALAEQAELSIANASQHLKQLRNAQLVRAEKKGLYVEYQLTDSDVCRFFVSLRTLAEARIEEIDKLKADHFAGRASLETTTKEELLRRVKDGTVTVLDVRPHAEYLAGHIPGAWSIPTSELQRRLTELPSGCDIVAYCRGPYCVMAIEAVELLRKNGFQAERLELGAADFRANGWPIQTKNQEQVHDL